METLNGHLSDPFSERELIEIFREKMLPVLHNETLNSRFDSLEDLRQVCKRFEKVEEIKLENCGKQFLLLSDNLSQVFEETNGISWGNQKG